MNTLFFDGFEFGDMSVWEAVGEGGVTVQSSIKHSGTYAGKIEGWADTPFRLPNGTAITVAAPYVRAYFMVDALPSAKRTLCAFQLIGNVLINTDGTLELSLLAGAGSVSTFVATPGTWFRLDFRGWTAAFKTDGAGVTTNSNTTLEDTRQSWVTNEHVGAVVTCNTQTMTVTGNTATVLTGSGGWSADPGDGYAYSIAHADYTSYQMRINGSEVCSLVDQHSFVNTFDYFRVGGDATDLWSADAANCYVDDVYSCRGTKGTNTAITSTKLTDTATLGATNEWVGQVVTSTSTSGTTTMTITSSATTSVTGAGWSNGTPILYAYYEIGGTTWPPDGQCSAVTIPTGESATYDQWAASAGNKHDCVDEWPPNDITDYIENVDVGYIQLFTHSGLGVGAASINAIAVWCRGRLRDSSGYIYARSSTKNFWGVHLYGDDTWVWMLPMSRSTNPMTNTAWTEATVDALEFGIQGYFEGGYLPQVTTCTVLVDYIPGTPAAGAISKISGVAWASVGKVSGVAEASISKVSGVVAN